MKTQNLTTLANLILNLTWEEMRDFCNSDDTMDEVFPDEMPRRLLEWAKQYMDGIAAYSFTEVQQP